MTFGISRKTGYKWVRRYELGGASALHERSRAPRDHPNAVDEDVVPIGVLDLKRAMERRDRQFGELIPIVDQSHRRPRSPYGR
jgi:helix-turn-helix protein